MIRKIIAVGGGECGQGSPDGTARPYKPSPIDTEIVRLAEKEHPRLLLLAHAKITPDGVREREVFPLIRAGFGDRLGCECRQLLSSEAEADPGAAEEAIARADIIYETGGNTFAMLNFWRDHGIDVLLRRAWENGTVMCGSSAGAICWFSCGNTDHPAFVSRPVNRINGLGFIDAYFSPHFNKEGKRESVVRSLRKIGKTALCVSDRCAVEFVGEEFRVIPGDAREAGFEPFALRMKYEGGVLREEKLAADGGFLPLETLTAP